MQKDHRWAAGVHSSGSKSCCRKRWGDWCNDLWHFLAAKHERSVEVFFPLPVLLEKDVFFHQHLFGADLVTCSGFQQRKNLPSRLSTGTDGGEDISDLGSALAEATRDLVNHLCPLLTSFQGFHAKFRSRLTGVI